MLILNAWLSIIVLMTAAWAIYLTIKNPGIIDVFWSLSITVCSTYFAFKSKQWSFVVFIYFALLLIWCFRLSGHLFFTRILPNIKEKRYIELSNNWNLPKNVAFFLHFQFQGILALIIASPFIWLGDVSGWNIQSVFTLLLITVGIIGETIADIQLFQFKKQSAGGICNVGLWRYSRHPNYFFEFCIWAGFGLGALSITNILSFLALISPALLLFLMAKVTGPITEASSIKSKGEAFKQYQNETSYFIPWIKRK